MTRNMLRIATKYKQRASSTINRGDQKNSGLAPRITDENAETMNIQEVFSKLYNN